MTHESDQPTMRAMIALAMLAVCLGATLPYLPTVDNYFAQDDFGVVQLLAGKPASYFPRWFTTTWMDDIWGFIPDEIRPFPAVTYQFTAWWGAASPVANHVVNIAFHVANGLLVFAVARVVTGLSLVPATFAALVFVLLPIQAESVAWITGRVDTIPAFFYISSFLLFAWWRRGRATPGARYVSARYAASLVLFFVALFSKQNTITMVPALMAYDFFVERRFPFARRARQSRWNDREAGDDARPPDEAQETIVGALWSWTWPYLPFVALTVGYLYLRYAVFGEVARESQIAQGTAFFGWVVQRHLRRLFLGDVMPGVRLQWAGIVAAIGMLLILIRWGRGVTLRTSSPSSSSSSSSWSSSVSSSSISSSSPSTSSVCVWGALLYFGPVWLFLGIAPIVVANYESPRHVYLASLGWAMVLGIVMHVLWHARPHRLLRPVAVLAAAALLTLHAVQLHAAVARWNTIAAVSKKAVADLEREALAIPEGSLVIAGAPASSWEWALPFAAQPPFTRTDISKRVHIVSTMKLHCCRAQWNAYTRHTLATWANTPNRPLLVALHWDATTGRLSKLTDREESFLRVMIAVLLETPTADTLDSRMQELLDKLVAGRFVR
jgi:hypothetical protein